MVIGVIKSSENVYWMDDSILDPFQVKKRKRIESIKNMLTRLKEVDLKTFIANVSVNSGIDGATVRKYLEMLEVAGHIQIKDGKVVWNQNDNIDKAYKNQKKKSKA
jgi:predicted transcriptional regulator